MSFVDIHRVNELRFLPDGLAEDDVLFEEEDLEFLRLGARRQRRDSL